MSREERKEMIRRGHPDLSLSRQCRLVSINRSSVYHEPKGESEANLALMERIDKLFLKYPFYGLPPDGPPVAARWALCWPSPGPASDTNGHSF